jgi:hypothetical protein
MPAFGFIEAGMCAWIGEPLPGYSNHYKLMKEDRICCFINTKLYRIGVPETGFSICFNREA